MPEKTDHELAIMLAVKHLPGLNLNPDHVKIISAMESAIMFGRKRERARLLKGINEMSGQLQCHCANDSPAE
jgi:hypothetical protein